jgi:Zn-dependent peptidase ImmA (M78 family)
VTKSDDSSLDPEQRRAVEVRARLLLDRAAAWDRYPTPVSDLLEAAKLTVAPNNLFNPANLIAYLAKKAADTAAEAATQIKSAITKVFGVYDSYESIIHIDTTVGESKQTFLKLHETGHHELPTHRKLFRLFQDCEKTLAPDVADLFEREANNFARFALFQNDRFAIMAADYSFGIQTPMKLAKKFGASVYASCREYARSNHRACAVYVLEKLEFCESHGMRGQVRRIEPSPSFAQQFGRPADTYITLDHPLGPVLPIGRKMSRPTHVVVTDRNGNNHECLAEAFDTTHNVIILVYPTKALTTTSIIMPLVS